jgi:cellulose synthase/poly-beta-1,6-N-acetylglucosamine synthase-like glycosyltransferase
MTLIGLLFALAFGAQVAYGALLYRGVRRARRRDPSQRPRAAPPAAADAAEEDLPPLSVVVAARDEEDDLSVLLEALGEQTHPRFEVVLVDDASTDATPRLAREWIDALSEGDGGKKGGITGRLVRVEEPQAPRKKHALTRGVAAARHPLLAFTDADCAPPPGWLAALARAHAAFAHAGGERFENAPLLIGYSPYRRDEDASLLNRFARWETFLAGALTAGACGHGRPYMAVGRNMSYSRALFERIGGFAHSERSMSGDDDLLVQEVHRRRAAPVRHVFGPETFVATDAPPSWRAWLRQKRRHVSAGRFYDAAPGAHLAAFNLTGALLWLAPLVLGWTGGALLAGKLAVQAAALAPAARAFDETELLPALPLWDLGYALYNAVVVPLGLAALPEEWG